MREEILVRNLLQHRRVLEAMMAALVGDRTAAEDLTQELAIVMTRKQECDQNKTAAGATAAARTTPAGRR